MRTLSILGAAAALALASAGAIATAQAQPLAPNDPRNSLPPGCVGPPNGDQGPNAAVTDRDRTQGRGDKSIPAGCPNATEGDRQRDAAAAARNAVKQEDKAERESGYAPAQKSGARAPVGETQR